MAASGLLGRPLTLSPRRSGVRKQPRHRKVVPSTPTTRGTEIGHGGEENKGGREGRTDGWCRRWCGIKYRVHYNNDGVDRAMPALLVEGTSFAGFLPVSVYVTELRATEVSTAIDVGGAGDGCTIHLL